jgi:pantetheine-phosphate adenylyltransferase
MKTAVYPGTFDPITLGHLDIIKRASNIFNKVVVAVVKSPSKDTLFSYQERLSMVKKATVGIKSVRVEGFDGLVVDFARSKKVNVIVRGLRLISDFEYEFQMALTNRNLPSDIETIFLLPHPEYSYISSKLIKEAARLGANLKEMLPPISLKALKKRFNKDKKVRHLGK